jgi:hypothetical protein
MMNNQKGQALIEALYAGLITMVSVTLFASALYRGIIYFTARHWVKDLVLCAASLSSKSECIEDFKKKTSGLVIFDRPPEPKINKLNKEIIVSLDVDAIGTTAMTVSRKIKLPLSWKSL